MNLKQNIFILIWATLASSPAWCQEGEKIQLGAPDDGGIIQEQKAENLANELSEMPDGVLLVKTNPDGSFKSLVVKATVEIEESLGAQKGKRIAHKEAEIQCKRELSKFLDESVSFVEGGNSTVTIITKGEASKDAAGNTVKIRNQQGTEVKVLTEGYTSFSAQALKGLTVLQSEVTEATPPEYVLIMGLSQKTLNQAIMVKDALAEKSPKSNTGSVNKPGTGAATGDDVLLPEKKTNPDANEYR